MFTSVVFSRDRPLQLSLCLNSIYENLPPEFQSCVSVLYNTSNTQYDKAYNVLNFESVNTRFVRQKNFLQDLVYMINRCNNDYVCFFTDDNIVYKKLPDKMVDRIGAAFDKNILTFSLRLGLNITKRQDGPNFINEPHPNFEMNDGYLSWYLDRIYHSYFGYPFSVDAHIYRKHDILQLISELPEGITNPNKFEEGLQNILLPNYFLSCFAHSYVFNSPNNKVQNTHIANRSGDVYPISTDSLLKRFLDGERLLISNIKIGSVECPHMEIDLN